MGVMKDRGILSSNPKDKPVIKDPEEIRFVLTVPAIWTDRSKQFMRVSAVEVNKMFYPPNCSYDIANDIHRTKVLNVPRI